MSLLLSGAKIATIAGTEMQVIEIYEGEAYTLPFAFTDQSGNAIDCTVPSPWTLATNAKYYNCDVVYTAGDIVNPTTEAIIINNLTLIDPQPAQPANLQASFTTVAGNTANIGQGFIYIPNDIDGNIALSVNDTDSLLTIVTFTVTRTDILSGLADVSREPIGLIIRYQ
jgi:hypothetical protein